MVSYEISGASGRLSRHPELSTGFLLILLQLPASGSRLPSFADYAVAEVFKGKPARVDFRSDPVARRFRTRLTAGAAKGPNFAGRFTVVVWGCGTACESVAIIDAKSGRVYSPLGPVSNGVCFRPDSALMITDPIDRETFEAYQGHLPEWLKTRYWKWDGTKMMEISSSRALMETPCDSK